MSIHFNGHYIGKLKGDNTFALIDRLWHKPKELKNMESKTYYYTDELNDEFSGIKRDTIKIDKNFKYIVKNPIWNACAFVLYRMIMTPIAFLYCKIKFHHKIVNKKCMQGFKEDRKSVV